MEKSAERIARGNVGYGAAGPWAIAKIWAGAPADIRKGVRLLQCICFQCFPDLLVFEHYCEGRCWRAAE
eukprot:COSAG02_NODE_2569_length_8510_cov_2048.640827_2_plen_69_part_00